MLWHRQHTRMYTEKVRDIYFASPLQFTSINS